MLKLIGLSVSLAFAMFVVPSIGTAQITIGGFTFERAR